MRGVLLSRDVRCPQEHGQVGAEVGGGPRGHGGGSTPAHLGKRTPEQSRPLPWRLEGCLIPGQTEGQVGHRGGRRGRQGARQPGGRAGGVCQGDSSSKGNSLFHGGLCPSPAREHRLPSCCASHWALGVRVTEPAGTGSQWRETAGSRVCLGLKGLPERLSCPVCWSHACACAGSALCKGVETVWVQWVSQGPAAASDGGS